ncbi:13283_t:CDS:2, partial [Gigaspora margarita]
MTAKKLSPEEAKELFARFDANKSGTLTLSEIQTAVLSVFPNLKANKQVIFQAYRDADTSGDHVVQFNEFERLIDRLQYYNVIYEIFHDLDKDENKSIDFEEFKKGYLKLLEKYSEAKLREEFNKIDKDHGGRIRFEE